MGQLTYDKNQYSNEQREEFAPYIQKALSTLEEMPMLNAQISSYLKKKDGHPVTRVSLHPACKFKSHDEAEAFGEKLAKLCFSNTTKLTNTTPLFLVARDHDVRDKFDVEINLAIDQEAFELGFASRHRLSAAVNAIQYNSGKLFKLLSENGIDMMPFKGFSEAQRKY